MSRTDFEAAYIERYGHRPRGWNDDFQVYQDAHANGAWFGWQAGAAGIEAKAAPVGVPVYQLQCREIGEGDWCPADLRHYTYCQRAPEMDTRIVEVQQARAAYQRQSGAHGHAYQGAREDLAIWKRRALEAEARVRQQDQIIDRMGEDLNAINGPTFMGEPVLPSERQSVVMPERQDAEDLWHPVMKDRAIGWNACLDEFARLNGGSHE